MSSVHRWSTLLLASALGCGNAVTSEDVQDAPVSYQLGPDSPDAGSPLKVELCHAGACKINLAPQYDLDFQVDWSECDGSAAQSPFAAGTTGVMLWPTTLVDLAIPLANSGWLCKLPPSNTKSECIVSASQSARELYIWGPVETACTFLWTQTPTGIDAILGSGCGMCKADPIAGESGATYAFNMGLDTGCRCPKARFTAMPAKP